MDGEWDQLPPSIKFEDNTLTVTSDDGNFAQVRLKIVATNGYLTKSQFLKLETRPCA